MSNREKHIKFDMNYCQHYAPQPGSLKQDYCALKCNAHERMMDAKAAGEPSMAPCIGGHRATDVLALCPQWVRRSREHAEKRADDIEEMLARMDVVGPAVSEWRVKPKPARDRREVIECPKCKGKLLLTQSSYNGHVHGHCSTEGCVSWME